MQNNHFKLSSYDYNLPDENIAQYPAARRELSKLLVMDCEHNTIIHEQFAGIASLFRPGDVMVVNNTKVFSARLTGRKETGGKVEMLLLHYPETVLAETNDDGWQLVEVQALIKSSKRPKPGSILFFGDNMQAEVLELLDNGQVRLTLRYKLPAETTLDDLFARYGQVPLPPYIKRPSGTTDNDTRRYQTEYARHPGSIAAPTAGLHFTGRLLDELRAKKVELVNITLHVGYGTFAPVRTEDIRSHRIHSEYISIPPETAMTVNEFKKHGSRIWAVGTTTARALEFSADGHGQAQPFQGLCDLYIYPGYHFRVVDNLITNFHLPRSSLLFLVSALAGRERILKGYQDAVQNGYRFYSYGDAMAIMTKS